MTDYRPHFAIALTGIGGALILAVSWVITVGPLSASTGPASVGAPAAFAAVFASLGILFGFVGVMAALLMFLTPKPLTTRGDRSVFRPPEPID